MRVLNFVLLFGLLTIAVSKDISRGNKEAAQNADVKWTTLLSQVHKIIRKLPRDLQLPATKLVFQLPMLAENLAKNKDSYLQNAMQNLSKTPKVLAETWAFIVGSLSQEVRADILKAVNGMPDLARLRDEITNIRGKLPQFQDVNFQTDVTEALTKIQKDLPKLWKNIQKKMPKALGTDFQSLLKRHLPDDKQMRQILLSILTTLDEKLPNLNDYSTTDIANHLKDSEKHVPEAFRDMITAVSKALRIVREKSPDFSKFLVTGKTIRVHVPVLVRQAVDNFPDVKSVVIDEEKLEKDVQDLLSQVQNGLPELMKTLSEKCPDFSKWKPESLPDAFRDVTSWIGVLVVGGPEKLPDMSQLSDEKGGIMKTLFASAGTKLKYVAHNINQHLSDGIQYVKEILPEPNPNRTEL